jgi:molecular chaperone GrpE
MSTEETEKVGEAAGEGAGAEGNGPSAQQTAQESAPDPVAVITAERDKMKDQLLRALADFDNFRKRSRRDIDDAKKRGQEEVLRELLPVFDNLERASSYARSATDTKAIAEGVEMVSKLFLDTLVRLGGRRVVSVGAPFDPNVHEAHPAGGELTSTPRASWCRSTCRRTSTAVGCCARRWWWCRRAPPRRPQTPRPSAPRSWSKTPAASRRTDLLENS